MNIGTRIRQRRQELNLTQAALAKVVGVSRVSVTQWESGETSPKGSNLVAVSAKLQCDTAWLVNGDKSKAPKSSKLMPISAWDNNTTLDADEVEVPFFSEVELSAGSGTYAVNENPGPKLRFAKSTLRKSGVPEASAACVRVSGNSMEPVLPDGATVGINTADTQIADGKMYAVEYHGMLLVKRLFRQPEGIELHSFNREEHPTRMITKDDMEQFRVLGRVFWYSVLI
ncbi:helix-turn-helix transcriptional regulator [Ferrimonas pelagia]|uniref:Transcriptional regulator AlpR n=1 Tax=Ferrimonas pelagia TaxID=1177826 RepID=A0ABP9EL63_9GAMM